MPVGSRVVYKRGDTGPPFRAQCLDGATPVDVTGSTARLLLRAYGQAPLAFSLNVEAGASGWVRRAWQASDLATVGVYQGEVEVTFPDGTRQTFPGNGYVTVQISEDLG